MCIRDRWNSAQDFDEGPNLGHRPTVKGGYFPVPPIDSLSDIRAAMCDAMISMGVSVDKHHHEVATAGQGEIGVVYNSLVKMADRTQIYKFCEECCRRTRDDCDIYAQTSGR